MYRLALGAPFAPVENAVSGLTRGYGVRAERLTSKLLANGCEIEAPRCLAVPAERRFRGAESHWSRAMNMRCATMRRLLCTVSAGQR